MAPCCALGVASGCSAMSASADWRWPMASWLAPAAIALGPVVGELVAHLLRPPPVELLEHLRRAPVARLAVRLEQGAVGDFLGQDVTECQRGDRTVILAIKEPATLDQRQVILEALGWHQGAKVGERVLLAERGGVGKQL